MIAYRHNAGSVSALPLRQSATSRPALRLVPREADRSFDVGAPLLREIDAALARHGMSPSRFGRNAVGDPRLVSDLRKGCLISPRRAAKVRACLAQMGEG